MWKSIFFEHSTEIEEFFCHASQFLCEINFVDFKASRLSFMAILEFFFSEVLQFYHSWKLTQLKIQNLKM